MWEGYLSPVLEVLGSIPSTTSKNLSLWGNSYELKVGLIPTCAAMLPPEAGQPTLAMLQVPKGSRPCGL